VKFVVFFDNILLVKLKECFTYYQVFSTIPKSRVFCVE